MTERFQRLRDSAADHALCAKACLLIFFRGSETTPMELGKEAVKKPKIRRLWLDFAKSAESFRVRILEVILSRRFRETRASDDFTALMDAGEDAHTGRIQGLWERVRQKADPDAAVNEWFKSGALKEWLIKQPEVLKAAREYAVAHLRYLFTRRLNGESTEVRETEPEETGEAGGKGPSEERGG